jgi:hypothetical protein
MTSILEEYRHYAGAKARELDEIFIEMFDENEMISRFDSLFRAAVDRRGLLTPPGSEENEIKDDNLVPSPVRYAFHEDSRGSRSLSPKLHATSDPRWRSHILDSASGS